MSATKTYDLTLGGIKADIPLQAIIHTHIDKFLESQTSSHLAPA